MRLTHLIHGHLHHPVEDVVLRLHPLDAEVALIQGVHPLAVVVAGEIPRRRHHVGIGMTPHLHLDVEVVEIAYCRLYAGVPVLRYLHHGDDTVLRREVMGMREEGTIAGTEVEGGPLHHPNEMIE